MAQFLTRIGQLGLGLAVAGSVVNSALYNGEFGHYYENSVFDCIIFILRHYYATLFYGRTDNVCQ